MYKELIDKLNEVDISAFLLKENCKGKLGEDTSCPVANYLRKHGCLEVSVNALEIVAGDEYITTPYNVSRFIEEFDDEEYPDLIIDD